MYYFAYGSNMNLAHMRRLCGWNCRPLGPARLEGFEFGMDFRGYNNIRPRHGEHVWGVLFEINEAALAAMDEFEGYPNVFGREEVQIRDNAGQAVVAWVYLEPADQFGGSQPKIDYLRRIVMGARENSLPQEWIAKLEKYLPQE